MYKEQFLKILITHGNFKEMDLEKKIVFRIMSLDEFENYGNTSIF